MWSPETEYRYVASDSHLVRSPPQLLVKVAVEEAYLFHTFSSTDITR
jgi:hypothetical protein